MEVELSLFHCKVYSMRDPFTWGTLLLYDVLKSTAFPALKYASLWFLAYKVP